jgi:ornithine cyclodeaminase
MTHYVSVIQQSQIDALHLNPATCVEWVKEAFLMKDDIQMPAKMSVHPQGEDFITSMPCLLPESQGQKYFGIKMVSRIDGQVPTLQSNIFLYDAKSGHLLAVVDGDWITAMRTGAVAALATKTLQRKGNSVYSIMGLGNIGRAVGLCLAADNRDRQITFRLLRYKDQAERFVERLKDFDNVNFEIVDDKRIFAAEADVLISAVTVATELLFPDDDLFRKGVTVIPVHMRGFQNCDLFFDKVFGDDTGQVSGFKYFNQFRQYDEFHHVLQGKNPGRTNDEERILSYNYGIALHDIFFASRIYERIQKGDGFNLEKQDKKLWL